MHVPSPHRTWPQPEGQLAVARPADPSASGHRSNCPVCMPPALPPAQRQTRIPILDTRHQLAMTQDLNFTIKSLRFDEDYRPSATTRNTTNFANLARGQRRQDNLRNTLAMINNRFNDLAHWDNAKRDRYALELDIISVEMNIGERAPDDAFPLIEILKPTIVDQHTGARIEGIAGNNFLPMCATTISACCCQRTTKTRRASTSRMILATCTASCSSISCTRPPTPRASRSRRSSASASPPAGPTTAPETGIPSWASNTGRTRFR